MTPTVCFLWCAVTLLSILSCTAQLTPLLLPLTSIKSPLKPRLLAVPARLAATNAAMNVLSQGAKIPKLPLGKPLGLSLAAKAAKLPGLSIAPPIKPVKSTKLGSTLLKSKVPKKATSVRLRSIGDEEGAEYLESLRSEEQSETFPSESINQNSELNSDLPTEYLNENPSDHLFKPRSPDQIESVDEFDYLTRAANPTDESESGFKSFVHKVEHGIANTFKKIDETLRPHSKHPQQEEKEIVSSPYASNDQDRYPVVIDNDAMEEYMKALNNEQGLILNYPYTTENVESVKNALNQFQQRLSLMRSKSTDEDALTKISGNEATTIEDIQKLLSQYSDDKPASAENAENDVVGSSRYNQMDYPYPYFISTNGLEYNPEYDEIWNPYADIISKMANAYYGNGYDSYDQYPSPYESSLYETVPVPNEIDLYKRESSSENVAASSPAPTLTRNSRQMSQFGAMPAGGIVNAALGLSQGIMGGDYDQISKAGVNLGSGIASTANGNYQQMSPMSFGKMPAGGIVNSALDLSQGIMTGDYDQISKAGVNLGTGVASATTGNSNPEYYKNSYPSKSQNIWNSANDLASSITNTAKNPNNIGTDQVFGSINNIWDTAKNLANNVGDSTGNLKSSPLSRLMNNKYSSGAQDIAGNIYKSASGLASNIVNVAKNPMQVYNTLTNPLSNLSKDRPIGSIYNSANNLAGSIVKPPDFGKQAKMGTLNQLMKLNAAANKVTDSAVNAGTNLNQLLGYNSNAYPSFAKSGVDMAKQIVSAAMMQKYFGSPTYGGGFFPRDSQADNIWNSANSLASNIYNAGSYPSMSENQALNSFYNPFNSIWGSATNLAQGIANTGMYKRMGMLPYYY